MVRNDHRLAVVWRGQFSFKPGAGGLVLLQCPLRCELALAITNQAVVIDGQFSVLHQLALCPVEFQPVVRPQRRSEEANTAEIDLIVVQKREACPGRRLAQVDAYLFNRMAIKLVVAGQVQHGHGPVLEQLDGLDAIGDVTSQDQQVRTVTR